MADFKVTTKDDYWISPNAVSITLNALGDCDRIQCSVASGANILCYVRGVDGLEFDVGHHYKYWPLSISPTYFDSHTEKYIYVAIPRSDEYGTQAMFVFPSELLDIYGKNAAGTQVGSVNHYYIFLQGIVSSSGYDGLTPRTWTQHPDWGWLDSAEAYSSGGDGTWWFYNAVTDMVTFLKKIAYAAFEYLRSDMVDTVSLNVSGRSDLNDVHIKGSTYGDHFQSSEYTGDGMFDTGFMLRYADGHAKMVIDDLVCRGKFTINEIEDRIWTYSGGNLIFSAAGSTIRYVEYLDANGTPLGYTYINSRWLLRGIRLLAQRFPWARKKLIQRTLTPEERAQVVAFRCYETSDNGTMQTRNWWHIDDIAYCQTLNRVKDKTVRSGEYSGALSNTVYARRVVNLGSKRIEYSDDDFIYDYVDLSRTDCDPAYDDWPIAGDVIVQRGNFTDTSRQGLTTIEVTGTQRGLKVYDNMDSYQKDGWKKCFLGYDADLKRGLLEVFGDCYIGAMGDTAEDVHNGETYVRYNAQTKTLDIKAHISASSTIGDDDKAVDQYVQLVMGPTIQNINNQQAIDEDKIQLTSATLVLMGGEAGRSVDMLNRIKADGKVTGLEKLSISQLPYFFGQDSYDDRIADAEYYGIDTTQFALSFTNYMAAVQKYSAATPEEILVESDFDALAAYMNAYADMLLSIADAAKKEVADITDDGIITGGTEKNALTVEYLKSCREYAKYMEQAGDYFGEDTATKTAAFTTAFTNMVKMLNNGETPTQEMLDGTWAPEWINYYTGFYTDTVLADTPTLNSENYRAVWNAYYLALNTLLKDITVAAKGLADQAQSSANTALGKLNDMADDGKLDPSEKIDVKKEFEACYHEMMDKDEVAGQMSGILDKAKDSGGNWIIDYNTYIKPYQDTFAAIGLVLNGGTEWTIPDSLTDNTMPSWLKEANMGATNTLPGSSRQGSSWRVRWSEFYTARAAVLTTLTEHAQKTADDAKTAAAVAQGDVNGMKYLKSAMKAKTDTEGGLMLTSLIVLRQFNGQPGQEDDPTKYTTWAGISGEYDAEALGDGIAAWYGGYMKDYEALTAAEKAQGWNVQRWAKTLFRMDGTGYVSGGNISWDAQGNPTIKGAVKIDTSALEFDGEDVTVALKSMLSMFELDTTTQPGTTLIKAKYSLYSVGDVSATGQSSSGGGGGGGASVLDDLNDVTISNPANGQALVYNGTLGRWKNTLLSLSLLSDVNLGTLLDGQVLTWSSAQQKWIASTSSAGVDMNAVWDALAASTYQQIAATHLSDAMNAFAYIQNGTIHIGEASITPATSMAWSDITGKPDTFTPSSHTHPWSDVTDKPSTFTPSSHTHSKSDISDFGSYLPLTGGTLTGALKVLQIDIHNSNEINNTVETLYLQYRGDYGLNLCNNGKATSFGGLVKIATGIGIEDASGAGMLVYHPNNFTGMSSTQWGVGAVDCQGVIRSDSNPLIHYKGGTAYEIIDASGGQSIANSLQVASVKIEQTNEINSQSGMLHLNYRVATNLSLGAGGGSVGIGTVSPSYKLQVSGDIYASGDLTAASDGRQKDIVADVELTVEQIAGAPAVKFRWKDKRDEKVHAGTIAQYWQEVLPEVVTDKDDSLGVNYGAAAMVSSINIAREVVDLRKMVIDQQQTILEQQEMIVELRELVLGLQKEVERLKYGKS